MAIILIMAANYCNPQDGGISPPKYNPQYGYCDFNQDDDIMQAGIVDLSACFDDTLFCQALNERVAKSKVAMEAGSVNVEDVTEDDSVFELFAAHADSPKGVTA